MTTVATATVLGGFWPVNGVNSLPSLSGESGDRNIVAKSLGNARAQLANREIMRALMASVTVFGTAAKTITRVVAAVELGGARPIETVTLVNRATTAGDVTEMTTDYLTLTTRTTFGAAPPANLDRNPLGTR